jgi:uncharacterized protein (TIGR03435 family)
MTELYEKCDITGKSTTSGPSGSKISLQQSMTLKRSKRLSGTRIKSAQIMIHHLAFKLLLALVAVPATVAFAQSPTVPQWQVAAGGKLSFEVASVRQRTPGGAPGGNVSLEGSDNLAGYSGGLVRTSGLLINYLIFAYKIQDASQYPLVQAQLPKWAQTEQFIVEAQPSGNPTKDQIRLMMQTLLAERFHLALHTETRQLPMYALTLDKPGKPGPNLQPHPDDGLCSKGLDRSAPPAKSSAPWPTCGLVIVTGKPEQHMRIMDFTMEQIAGGLETVGASRGGLDQIPILDRTGLTGKFDIDLDFLPAPKPGSPPNPEAEPEAPAPSFVEALKAQAGLNLVRQTGPVDVFVIDHIEQPSEN